MEHRSETGIKPFFSESVLDAEKKVEGSSRFLKGILKSKIGNHNPNNYIDFDNDCTISNEFETQVVTLTPNVYSTPRIENLNPGSMETNEISDSLEDSQNQNDKENDSYFFSCNSTSPKKFSKWTRGGLRREREASSLSSSNEDFYEDAIPISLSNRSNGGKCQPNYSGRPESSSLTRRFIFRIFQLASIVLIIMGIITLVNPSILSWSPNLQEFFPNVSNYESDPKFNIHQALIEWAVRRNQNPQILPSSNSTQLSLLDISNFQFTLNNFHICQSSAGNSNEIYFVILIHSSPDHFIERQAIRTTWGSVKSFRNWSIRLVFLLGQLSITNGGADFIEEGILNEGDLYGDIVAGNFDDTYRNLSYKHIMGYKWALTHCPSAKFVIKTDDDAFIDVFQVMDFTQRNYGFNPNDILLCNIYPEGTKPVRNASNESSEGYKWIVTQAEYPFDIYPKYCGGLGYLITMDVIERLLEVSETLTRFLWIDDVFVTGVIRELAQKEPFYLNLRYSYDELEYRNWLNDRSPKHRLRKIPYMFVHVTRGSRYDEDMARLWRKTVRAWS